MNMTIKALSAEHATKIFEELRSKGYTYRMSYLNMQEWVHPDLETVIVGKFYGYHTSRGYF